VENVDLVPVTEAPKGAKALGGFLLGMLQAEVSVANIKALFGFLGDRIGAKPIKMNIKAPDGRELNIEASSQAEFDYAYQKAQEFLKGMKSPCRNRLKFGSPRTARMPPLYREGTPDAVSGGRNCA
jgi:hypothetical protein